MFTGARDPFRGPAPRSEFRTITPKCPGAVDLDPHIFLGRSGDVRPPPPEARGTLRERGRQRRHAQPADNRGGTRHRRAGFLGRGRSARF